MSQQFCLKWNNHMNNMMDVFKNLLSTESMEDVTFACDGLSLKAHKMVLSACSPFFQALFLENPSQHPIVILEDMKYTELKAIIEFMYHGEVNVAQDQLSALVKTAETLRVNGLAEVANEKGQASQEDSGQSNTDAPPPHSKRRKVRNRKRSLSGSDYSDSNEREPKIKQPTSPDIEELSGDISMDNSRQFQNVQQSSRVPMQSHSSNSYHKTSSVASSQDLHMEGGASENKSEFGVESAKLLQQSLTTEKAEDLDINSGIHGNWTLGNAKSRLHQFLQINKLNPEYKYSEEGPDHYRDFQCEMSFYVQQLNRNIYAKEHGSNKKMASKACALSLVRQLYQLKVIEGYSGVAKKKETDKETSSYLLPKSSVGSNSELDAVSIKSREISQKNDLRKQYRQCLKAGKKKIACLESELQNMKDMLSVNEEEIKQTRIKLKKAEGFLKAMKEEMEKERPAPTPEYIVKPMPPSPCEKYQKLREEIVSLQLAREMYTRRAVILEQRLKAQVCKQEDFTRNLCSLINNFDV